MSYIKAPYNFVPISDKVVFPEWGKYVSHDIPFIDGESGTITFQLKAESPVFVRQGHKPDEEENSFSNHRKNFFIPGSSFKGALRQMVEIITFSKMDSINDLQYSVRDFQNDKIYPKTELPQTIHAAWLKMDGNHLYLKDCGIPGRISMDRIDEKFGSSLKEFFLKGGGFEANNSKHKSARFKYNLMGNDFNPDRNFSFKKDPSGKANNVDPREIYRFDESGSGPEGKLVFTGQASNRIEPQKGKASGKIFEFVFFESNEEYIKIPDSVKKNFYQAYYEHDKNNQSIDWKWRKKQLKEGKNIPVFFRYGNDNIIIRDIGLSFLYKITYDHSIKDLLPDVHKSVNNRLYKPDLAETIFGYTTKNEALKGRVHISHAFLNDSKTTVDKPKQEVLSSPKPTYYPTYIYQKGILNAKKQNHKLYLTYNDKNAELAGRKIYPVHKNAETKLNSGEPGNKVSTTFIPLKHGAVFEVKIRIHNLKKIEIGALLSALTFHGNQGRLFHRIGMAKPLGYGKMSLSNLTLSDSFKFGTEEYLGAFEGYMVHKLKSPWHSSEQITELYTMCSEQQNRGNSLLEYMKLGRGKGNNAFVEAKQKDNMEALNRYSKLEGIDEFRVNSLMSDKYIQPQDIPVDINELFQNKYNIAYGNYIKKVSSAFASLGEQIADLPTVSEMNSIEANLTQLIQKKNQVLLNNLALEADELMKNRKFALAKEKYLIMQDLCPENLDIINKIKSCDNAIKLKDKQLVDLLSSVNTFNEGRTIIDKYKKNKPLEDEDITEINVFVGKFYDPKNKVWKSLRDSNWKQVAQWIGKNKAKDLLEKLKIN